MDSVITFISGATLGGFLGAAIKTLVDHRLGVARVYENIRVTEYNKAAAEFRSAFVDIQYALNENLTTKYPKPPSHIIIEDIVRGHEKAKLLFEPHVNPCELDKFKKTWANYKNIDYLLAVHESQNTIQSNHIGDIKRTEFYIDNVNAMLDCAKPKTETIW